MNLMDIAIENLTFSYEALPVLKDITIHATGGERIGVIGENGAGKSTLLKLMVGLHSGFSGQIRVGGVLVENKTLPEIRKRIGYVFQDSESQLFMPTVYEDVVFAPRNYGLPETEAKQRARQALERVGAWELRDKQNYKLSGGEKKLVSIATILSMTPDCILMDEPSAALDPKNRRQLIRLLNSIDSMKWIASHDLDFIMDTCDRVLLIEEGTIICDGLAGDILKDKELLEGHGLELPLSLQATSK